MANVRERMYRLYAPVQRLITPGLQSSQHAYKACLERHIAGHDRWLDLGCGHKMWPDWIPDSERLQREFVRRSTLAVGIDADHLSLQKNVVLSFTTNGAWVTIADANSLDLTTGMTIEAWVNPTSGTSWRTVVLKESAGGLAYSLYSANNASRPAGYVHIASDLAVTGTSAVPLNAWTHLAITYDGSAFRMYMNGTLVKTTAISGAMATSAGALRIGGNAVWGEYFKGAIDEVRIYSRALSAGEIQTDMTTPIQ